VEGLPQHKRVPSAVSVENEPVTFSSAVTLKSLSAVGQRLARPARLQATFRRRFAHRRTSELCGRFGARRLCHLGGFFDATA
jgi:hypothetical protein